MPLNIIGCCYHGRKQNIKTFYPGKLWNVLSKLINFRHMNMLKSWIGYTFPNWLVALPLSYISFFSLTYKNALFWLSILALLFPLTYMPFLCLVLLPYYYQLSYMPFSYWVSLLHHGPRPMIDIPFSCWTPLCNTEFDSCRFHVGHPFLSTTRLVICHFQCQEPL